MIKVNCRSADRGDEDFSVLMPHCVLFFTFSLLSPLSKLVVTYLLELLAEHATKHWQMPVSAMVSRKII